MPVAARPLPRPADRRPPPIAGRGRRPPPASSHHAPPKTDDTLKTVLIVAAVAIAVVVGVGVVWEYGAARNLPGPPPEGTADAGAGAEAGRRSTAPTLVYRDMRDGRVMVMEVGPDGTRIKGTMDKSGLAIAEDSSEGGSQRAPDPSSVDRVNALGSAFR